MALKFFLLYAGVFLGSWIIIIPLIKQFSSSFKNLGKRPLFFSLISSVIASGVAFGATYLSNNQFTIFWILSAIFLVFGLLTVWLIHKKYFRARADNRNKQLFAEILFGFAILFLCVAAFSSLQYFLKDKNFMFFPMLLCMLFYFIPLLLLHTFDAAYEIPPPQYPTWQYPIHNPIDVPDEKENERLYVIGFEIGKKATDVNRTYFRAKAPEDMLLGDLFYHFTNDYNELQPETPIEYRNKDLVQEWMFRTKPKWYNFSKLLDPTLTVRHNKIKENTIIICERVES